MEDLTDAVRKLIESNKAEALKDKEAEIEDLADAVRKLIESNKAEAWKDKEAEMKDLTDAVRKLIQSNKDIGQMVARSSDAVGQLIQSNKDVVEKFVLLGHIQSNKGEIQSKVQSYKDTQINKEIVEKMIQSVDKMVQSNDKLIQSSKDAKKDWTSAPTYSKWVNDYTGAHTPFEQSGVYATFFGGIVYWARSWIKANHVMRAAEAPPDSPQREAHQAMGYLTDAQIRRATFYRNKFIARGIIGGFGPPLLWLAYIRNKKTKK